VRSVRVWADGQHLSYWLLPGHDLPPEVERFVVDPDAWISRTGPRPRPSTACKRQVVFVGCFILKANDGTQKPEEVYVVNLPPFRVVLSPCQLGIKC
jgi:hypothetical protein